MVTVRTPDRSFFSTLSVPLASRSQRVPGDHVIGLPQIGHQQHAIATLEKRRADPTFQGLYLMG